MAQLCYPAHLERLSVSDGETKPNWCSQVQSVWRDARKSSRVVQGLAAQDTSDDKWRVAVLDQG